ncbi:hypothetical protein ACIPPQ_18980 [Sphingopyxis sp. LARHCG72]
MAVTEKEAALWGLLRARRAVGLRFYRRRSRVGHFATITSSRLRRLRSLVEASNFPAEVHDSILPASIEERERTRRERICSRSRAGRPSPALHGRTR